MSQSITPVDIKHVAAEAGVLPDELEPYGKHKAKVSTSVGEPPA